MATHGYQSAFFKLFRGIRQGCPLSVLLFLIPAELIAIIIRNSSEIHGLTVNEKCIKLCQLADDMTLFLTDMLSVKKSLQLFEEFYRYAGVKLNKNKTEAIIIYHDGSPISDVSLGIKWVNKPFKTLGTWFSFNHEEMTKLNVSDKIEKIKGILNPWFSRSLTLKGKITVVKSLVLPYFLQLVSVLSFSSNLLSHLEKLIFDFVWNNKQHLVSKSTLIKPVELSGMKMVSILDFAKTTQIMFIKRLCNHVDAKWKYLSEYLMGSSIKHLKWKRLFKNIKNLPKTKFYRDLLSTWCYFTTTKPKSFSDFLEEPLFYNDLITIDGKSITSDYSTWIKNVISIVRNIFSENLKALPKCDLEAKYNISINDMKYNQIVGAVFCFQRSLNKNFTEQNIVNIPKQCRECTEKVKSAQIYKYLITCTNQTPTSQSKWIEYYPFLEKADWQSIYTLVSKLTKHSLLVTFQFKILHRIFNCNYKLFVWGIKSSPACSR